MALLLMYFFVNMFIAFANAESMAVSPYPVPLPYFDAVRLNHNGTMIEKNIGKDAFNKAFEQCP